jgi:hypothetical protein
MLPGRPASMQEAMMLPRSKKVECLYICSTKPLPAINPSDHRRAAGGKPGLFNADQIAL